MLKVIQKNNGGAMLAALILMPVVAAGSLAAYQMANKSANVIMMAAMEEDAMFASDSVADILIGKIGGNSALRDSIVDSAEGAMLFGTSAPATLTRNNPNPRYEKLKTLYTVQKLSQGDLAEEAEPNTIAIEITTRTYNIDNPSWNTTPHVEHKTYQEFNMGLVKVGGCAANYDFFAENEYKKTVFFAMGFGANAAFYAGSEWKSVGFDFSIGQECIDTPGDAYKIFAMPFVPITIPINICPWSRVDCDINPPITFENALYGKSDSNRNGQSDDHDGIQRINMNGNNGNSYASSNPFPFNSMEKTVIDQISKDARPTTTHAAALAAMNADSDVSRVGNWYFRDTNNNNIPDIDSPYFYHEGALTTAFPFNMRMFRFRNSYLYVNGNIETFQMGSGTGMNAGQLYLMASGDVWKLDMMNMTMMDAGLVVMAGGSITGASIMETTMMSGSGIGSGTMMANNNIDLNKGMSMSFVNRQRLLAKNDIEEFSGFSMNMGPTGNGSCGCTGTPDETTEMQIGRRFSKS